LPGIPRGIAADMTSPQRRTFASRRDSWQVVIDVITGADFAYEVPGRRTNGL